MKRAFSKASHPFSRMRASTSARPGTEKKGRAYSGKRSPGSSSSTCGCPKWTGFEVLSRVKGIDPEAVVVVISGHGTISTAVEAVKMGAVDFLEKPLSIEKVLDVISRGLAGKTEKERNGDDLHIEMARDRAAAGKRRSARAW